MILLVGKFVSYFKIRFYGGGGGGGGMHPLLLSCHSADHLALQTIGRTDRSTKPSKASSSCILHLTFIIFVLRWYEVCTVPTTCNPHHMPGHKKTNLNCVDFIRLQLNVDQSVMVNYNPDCPQQRGFWYEAIVTRKLERERKVFCKLLLG